jgi:RHS repeat-associated protein
LTYSFNLRFPDQYYDAETGLNYNYFRDFDPATGRYVESDPIGLAGGSYLTYAYVDGDPINNTDPSGLQTFPETEPPIEQLPPAVRQSNNWNDPDRQLRREFRQPAWTPPVSQIPKQQCWTSCPAQDSCKAPTSTPIGAFPTLGHPGCYSQCSAGPFMSPVPPVAPPAPTAPPRSMTNGDWTNFLTLIWTLVFRK